MAKKARLIQSVFLVAVIAFMVISVSGDEVFGGETLSLGYSTAFEGPKATFYGIDYDGKHYTGWQWYQADPHRFDTYLRFDADGNDPLYGSRLNIMGEETSIFYPKTSDDYDPWWLPDGWFREPDSDPNPITSYEWDVNDKVFRMELWELYWYVTMDAEFDGLEKPGDSYSQFNPNVYYNAEVWFELDLEPVQYFAGQDVCYFAIAKVQMLEDVERRCKLDGDIGQSTYSDDAPRSQMSVHPESESSLVYIYNEPWGGERVEKDAIDFQGFELNPTYFEDKVYCHVDLNNFGAVAWKDLGIWEHVKADSATWAFKVSVFVVGEWNVQDVEEPPELYGRFTQSRTDLADLLDDLMGLLFSPFGLLIIAIAVIVLFPEAISALGGKKSSTTNTLIIVVAAVAFLIFVLPWLLRTFGGG